MSTERIAQLEAELAQYRAQQGVPPAPPVKLDIGCGTKPKEGFIAVDIRQFPGVQVVLNAGADRWPWPDQSIDEVHCSHMLEHLTQAERCHFLNELYRVLKPGRGAQIVTPYSSNRACGDPTHKWPPVVPMFYCYANAAWRKDNAPHDDALLTCDFDFTHGFATSGRFAGRNEEFVRFAVENYVDAADDMIVTLIRRA